MADLLQLNPATTPSSFPLDDDNLIWGKLNRELYFEYCSVAFESFYNIRSCDVVGKPIQQVLSGLNQLQLDALNRAEDDSVQFTLISQAGTPIYIKFHRPADGGGWYLYCFRFGLKEDWLLDLFNNYRDDVHHTDSWTHYLKEIANGDLKEGFRKLLEFILNVSRASSAVIAKVNLKSRSLCVLASSFQEGRFLNYVPYEDLDRALIDSISNCKSLIDNNYDTERPSPILKVKGLNRILLQPIHRQGQAIGLIGLANRDAEFTEIDASNLFLFGSLMWHYIDAQSKMELIEKQARVINANRASHDETLIRFASIMANAVEASDPYTAGHQRAVAELSTLIGQRLGFSDDRLRGLRLGALIHDIGKLSIPIQLLSKPSRLTDDEFNIIKTHSEKGEEILSDLEFPWPIREMVSQHHERLDGSGYPNGLREDEIILEAKIIAVADVADAILSHRPYRPALGYRRLQQVFEKGRGIKYDTELVSLCLEIVKGRYTSAKGIVANLELLPVTRFHLDTSIHSAKRQMEESNGVVALVEDDDGASLGLVDNACLNVWLSPLLGSDLERAIDREHAQRKVTHAMRKSVPYIEDSASIDCAQRMMHDQGWDYLFVRCSGGKVRGLLTWKVLAKLSHDEAIHNEKFYNTIVEPD